MLARKPRKNHAQHFGITWSAAPRAAHRASTAAAQGATAGLSRSALRSACRADRRLSAARCLPPANCFPCCFAIPAVSCSHCDSVATQPQVHLSLPPPRLCGASSAVGMKDSFARLQKIDRPRSPLGGDIEREREGSNGNIAVGWPNFEIGPKGVVSYKNGPGFRTAANSSSKLHR
jgi:hypothetical protein